MTLKHSDNFEELKGEFYREYLRKKGSEQPFYFRGVEFTIFFDYESKTKVVQSISGKTCGERSWLGDINDINEAAHIAIDIVKSMGLFNGGRRMTKPINDFSDAKVGDKVTCTVAGHGEIYNCLLYTSPSPRDS